jgi:hypothetical protein
VRLNHQPVAHSVPLRGSLFMNQEAHDIVDELKTFDDKPKGGGVYEVTGALSFLAFRTARLQVLLAEEQERSAAKLERFTKWLVYFTIGLFFLGIIQIILMFCGH